MSNINSNPDLRTTYDALSLGSLHSCDPVSWDIRLRKEKVHHDVLEDLYEDKERERWRMVAFRKKKICLDRAVGEFISMALKGESKDPSLLELVTLPSLPMAQGARLLFLRQS